MAMRSDGYTRTVNTLKVVLPLVALGLLSTLFFFSGEVDPTESIPYAELNIEELAREQRITSPYFAGVTSNDTAVTVTGNTVVPDPDNADIFTIDAVNARFVSTKNEVLDAVAATGLIDTDAGTVRLSGGTLLTTSDGIEMQTEGILGQTQTGDLESLGPVNVEGPFGTLSAHHMSVKRPSADAPHQIVFTGEVKLLYTERDN